MKFISHTIVNPIGNGKTFNEWLEDYLQKTAAEAKPECDGDPRGQCRGQVINNDNQEGSHSYQEGESVDGKKDETSGGKKKSDSPKSEKKESSENAENSEKAEKNAEKKAHCAKDMGECSKAGDVTEEHSDAASADKGKEQAKQKINNDPNYQKGESNNPSKVNAKNKKTEASKQTGFKKVASLNRNEKIKLIAAIASMVSKKGTPVWPLEYVEAMVGMKISNLKNDEKEWFKKFWEILYPAEYVEEMVKPR